MVLFAIERQAALEALELAQKVGIEIWLGADAIGDDECKTFREAGIKISRFSYSLADATSEEIASCLETIEEHHPGESIWIQHRLLP